MRSQHHAGPESVAECTACTGREEQGTAWLVWLAQVATTGMQALILQ